jgi:hypothetical protein
LPPLFEITRMGKPTKAQRRTLVCDQAKVEITAEQLDCDCDPFSM